jgi:hypothetical protein
MPGCNSRSRSQPEARSIELESAAGRKSPGATELTRDMSEKRSDASTQQEYSESEPLIHNTSVRPSSPRPIGTSAEGCPCGLLPPIPLPLV